MIPSVLTALVALSAPVVLANPIEVVDKRASCNGGSLGASIAQSIIGGLGPLAGTSFCYKLLNVPKTTTTITRTKTITSRPAVTTTAPLTITQTVTSPTISATVTTATTDMNLHKRQNTRKPHGNGGAPANPTGGSAASAACSCILGANPTQTITLFTTTTTTTTATQTKTATSTATATTTAPAPTSTAVDTVHFQRVFSDTGSGCDYTGDQTADTDAVSVNDCLNRCAAMGPTTCKSVFIEAPVSPATTYTCKYSNAAYTSADQVCAPASAVSISASYAYNRQGTN